MIYLSNIKYTQNKFMRVKIHEMMKMIFDAGTIKGASSLF